MGSNDAEWTGPSHCTGFPLCQDSLCDPDRRSNMPCANEGHYNVFAGVSNGQFKLVPTTREEPWAPGSMGRAALHVDHVDDAYTKAANSKTGCNFKAPRISCTIDASSDAVGSALREFLVDVKLFVELVKPREHADGASTTYCPASEYTAQRDAPEGATSPSQVSTTTRDEQSSDGTAAVPPWGSLSRDWRYNPAAVFDNTSDFGSGKRTHLHGRTLQLLSIKGRAVFALLISIGKSKADAHSRGLCLLSPLFSIVSDTTARKRKAEELAELMEMAEKRLHECTADTRGNNGSPEGSALLEDIKAAWEKFSAACDDDTSADADVDLLESALRDKCQLALAFGRPKAVPKISVLFWGIADEGDDAISVRKERDRIANIPGVVVTDVDELVETGGVLELLRGGCGGRQFDYVHIARHGRQGRDASALANDAAEDGALANAVRDYAKGLPKSKSLAVVINTCYAKVVSVRVAMAASLPVVHPGEDEVYGWYAADWALAFYRNAVRGRPLEDAVDNANNSMEDQRTYERFVPEYVIRSSKIELRDDQRALVERLFEGSVCRNGIMTAPTGFGKTQMAPFAYARAFGTARTDVDGRVEYAQPSTRAESPDAPGAFVFVVDKYDLALQQSREIALAFASLGWNNIAVKCFVGDRDKKKGPGETARELAAALRDRDHVACVVTVDTILLAALNDKVASLDDIAMLAFDECHLCDKDHPYNVLMKRHWRPRNLENIARNDRTSPVVVGLTATPFAGGKRDRGAIDALMCNLCSVVLSAHEGRRVAFQDMACDFKAVRDSRVYKSLIALIKACVGITEKNWPKKDVGAFQAVKDSCKEIADEIAEVAGGRTHVWLAKLEMQSAALKRSGLQLRISHITTITRLLRRSARSMHILYTVGSNEACEYLFAFVDREKHATDPASRDIYEELCGDGMELDNLLRASRGAECRSPLMSKLCELLGGNDNDNGNSHSTLVMCEMRCAVKLLHKALQSEKSVARLNPECLVGVNSGGATAIEGAPGDDPKSTTSERKAILAQFRAGECRVLVATKVAHQGINIPVCSRVVSIGLSLNANEFVHTKGRARRDDGVMVAIDFAGSTRLHGMLKWEEAETQGQRAIATVRADGRIGAFVLSKQQQLHDAWTREDAAAKEKDAVRRRSAAANSTSDYVVCCASCQAEIGPADDLVVVNDAHRCVSNTEWASAPPYRSSLLRRNSTPDKFDAMFSTVGRISCSRCKRVVGSVLRIEQPVPIELAMPSIKAVCFRSTSDRSKVLGPVPKWKSLPLDLPSWDPMS